MSQLANQEGLLLCVRKCRDNLEIKRRPATIARTLADNAAQQEGVDWRWVDRAFSFGAWEDEVF